MGVVPQFLRLLFYFSLISSSQTSSSQEELLEEELLEERKAIDEHSNRFWPIGPDGYPVVPYTILNDTADEETVATAVNTWQEHTCIKFHQLTPADGPLPHMKFYTGNDSYSVIGMSNDTEGQVTTAGYQSTEVWAALQGIGHAIGLFYEQSRCDRDEHVHINPLNVRDESFPSFLSLSSNYYSTPYDLTSVMHLSSRRYTKMGGVTIATKNPLDQELLKKREMLSHYDKLQVNSMYSCTEKWLAECGQSDNPCQNDGYLGVDCQCVCRRGTFGDHCETVKHGYYENLHSECSENITSGSIVTSPGYPNPTSHNTVCVKWIQAPECYVIQTTFSDFQLHERTDNCGPKKCCYFDVLEIRTHNRYYGHVHCGTEIRPGQKFTSLHNEMVLYFETNSNRAAWSIELSFIPSPRCLPEEPDLSL